MKKTTLFTSMLATIAVVLLSSFAGPKWEMLGSRQVNYAVDHDEIVVTGWEGKFEAIKIKVVKGPINMHKVIVHFRNGGKQEIELRNNFKAGSESRVVDLTGDDRVIRKIDLWYDTKNASKKRATVQVWGRH